MRCYCRCGFPHRRIVVPPADAITPVDRPGAPPLCIAIMFVISDTGIKYFGAVEIQRGGVLQAESAEELCQV